MKKYKIQGRLNNGLNNNLDFEAEYNDNQVVVYQAFNDRIADYAIQNKRFGGEFKFSRTTWIKPSFLWMMHRSKWGNEEDQERILSIYLNRNFFDSLLDRGLSLKEIKSYNKKLYMKNLFQSNLDPISLNQEKKLYSKKGKKLKSNIIIQYDPDRNLNGEKLEQKAIQIGIRGDILGEYHEKGIERIKDITSFVRGQLKLLENKQYDKIKLPDTQLYKKCKP